MLTVPWQDKGQVVSLRRSRLEHAAVEVAIVIRTPEGRYVHRRMRCSGSDLKSGLGHLFDPNPETLAHAGEPSFPRAVEPVWHFSQSSCRCCASVGSYSTGSASRTSIILIL